MISEYKRNRLISFHNLVLKLVFGLLGKEIFCERNFWIKGLQKIEAIQEAKFYKTSKIGKIMIPSAISVLFRVQINGKLNSHLFSPLDFKIWTNGSKLDIFSEG